jgi:hypothetical protein
MSMMPSHDMNMTGKGKSKDGAKAMEGMAK